MKFLEKDLEEIICTSDRSLLKKRGLNVQGKLLRQLKIGNYGRADLVTIERPKYELFETEHYKGLITVFELKQNNVSVSAFLQALGYLNGIRSFLDKSGLENYFNYKIVLVGSNIDTSSTLCYLPNFCNGDFFNLHVSEESTFQLDLITYQYKFDGILFTNHKGYLLTNEGF